MISLNKTEFYDVYGISLILSKNPNIHTVEFLIYLLEPIVKKYYDISKYAILTELRHFKNGGFDSTETGSKLRGVQKHNKKILKSMGIKHWGIERNKLTIKQACFLLSKGQWDICYGGKAWKAIAKAILELEKSLPIVTTNIIKVISMIDLLNDLEHHTDLYLSESCTFELYNALGDKLNMSEKTLISHCSKEIRQIYNDMA
jgi:hypothetical protein